MTACPDSGDLDRFINDELDAAARTRLAAHVASCASCMETLDGLADDTETARWRQLFATPRESGELAFLARLASSPPGATAKAVTGAQSPWPSLPGYQILELLGTGGMGAVYLAHHESLDRKVAVKVLRTDLARDADAVRRFQTSIQLLARLDPHPNLAWAMHAGEHEGTHFLVMEYVAGMNLRTMVQQQGPFAVDQACRYIRQAALGLEHAHRSRIIHRDVKPANLVLTPEGNIKVIDLGLARQQPTMASEEASSLTQFGAVLGTLDYLAPEQARDSRSADARSDLYGLGCAFYFLLTGKPPFAQRNPLENVVAHALEDPVPIRTIRPDVPAAVAEIVHKLLSKKPEDRYPSARALIDALDNRDRPTPDVRPTPKRSRKWLGVALGVLVLLLLPLAYVFGPQVIRIATNKGELVIETDDPNIEVLIKQGGATIIDPTTKRSIDLKVGDYDIELSEAKEGLQLSTKKFTLTRGGRAVVKVWFEPTPPRQPKTPAGSPLDMLDPKTIPVSERFDWQPMELVAVIGEHRQRGWASVSALSLHPKGTQLATSHHPGPMGYWEVPSGKTLWSQSKLDGRFFHPDGKHILSRHKHVWNISGDQPFIVGEIPGDNHEYYCSSRDAKLVVTWSENRTDAIMLDCFDLRKIREVGRIADTGRAAISPDGKLIAVGSGSRQSVPIRILEWDGKQTKFRFELSGKGQPAYNFRGSPFFSFALDGRLGTCNDDGVFRLWDVSGKEPKLVVATPKVDAQFPVFSPDGQRVALASQSRIQFWRIDGSKLEKTSEFSLDNMRLNTSHVESVAFLPDGNRVVTGHLNGAVRFWDITEKLPKEINPIKPGVSGRFEVSSDGKRLILAAADKRLARYVFGGAAPQAQPFAGAYLEDPTHVLISSDTSVVSLHDKIFTLLDEPAQLSMPIEAQTPTRALSGDGRLVLINTKDGKLVSLWSLASNRERLSDWIDRASEDSWVIGPSGRNLLQHDPRGKISLWLHAAKKLTKTSEVNCSSIAGMTISPDGKIVAVFPVGNPILLYAVRDDKLVPLPPSTFGRLHGDGCFSPDGKQLARCGHGAVHVYDYPSGKLRHEWKFPGIVQRVLFAPDNRHLFVLGYNGVLYILRLPPPPTPAAVEAAWLKMVADLPAEKQVDAVREKLIDLNPGFDGRPFMGHAEGGSVFSVSLGTDNIKNISPLRVWPGLRFLSCDGSAAGKGQLADLSPLKGMKLKGLHCQDTQVADLSPLAGMPFGYLNLMGTKVTDLTPLKGMKLDSLRLNKTPVTDLKPVREVELTSLDVSWTPVADLTPLEGMKLNALSVAHTKVTDLRPLKGMLLYSFNCDGTGVESLAPLKDMPLTRLQVADTKIPDLSALEGMKLTYLECDRTLVKDLSPLRGMKLTHLQCSVTRVDDLGPLEKMKLKSLDCGGTGVSSLLSLKGMPLESLTCGGTKVSDLKPLAGTPLTSLDCQGTQVSDLSPLKGMKLESLHFSNTKVTNIEVLKGMPITYLGCAAPGVTDLSPLKGMPLKTLYCIFKAERDTAILRSIKTLEKINDKPADEFWKSIGKLP